MVGLGANVDFPPWVLSQDLEPATKPSTNNVKNTLEKCPQGWDTCARGEVVEVEALQPGWGLGARFWSPGGFELIHLPRGLLVLSRAGLEKRFWGKLRGAGDGGSFNVLGMYRCRERMEVRDGKRTEGRMLQMHAHEKKCAAFFAQHYGCLRKCFQIQS